jgi:hypothetical protein
LGNANKQTSSIRLVSELRGNEAPKALAAVIGVDHQFKWLRLRFCRNDLADLFKRLAGAFPMGAIRPVLDSAQFLFRIAGLFEPALAQSKDFLPIVEQEDWQRRVKD